jgi:16S rRNA (uracil1498-N3)-methyltransferase
MSARVHVDLPLHPGEVITLPASAARHVQVLRLQPGSAVTLFSGAHGVEGEFEATVARMGRSDVDVLVGAFCPTAREAVRVVTLAVGMPANDRMDWLVEKATELGVAAIQPLTTDRSVLRLAAERADKKVAHWRGVAIAACEQSGRNRVPLIHPPMRLADWLLADASGTRGARFLLSLQGESRPLATALAALGNAVFLSGPEGGLSAAEEAAAVARGFMPVTLGPRVLRAETAPLAALSLLALSAVAV